MKSLTRTTMASAIRGLMRGGTFALLAFALMSCKPRAVSLVSAFDRDFTFVMDSNTGLTGSDQLTRADVQGALDIEDLDLNGVNITSVVLETAPGTGNVATDVTVDVAYIRDNNPASTLATGITIPLGSTNTLVLTGMAPAVMDVIKADLLAMLNNGGPNTITVRYTITGRTPAATRVVMNSIVRVNLTLSMTGCYDLPNFPPGVFDNLPECTPP